MASTAEPESFRSECLLSKQSTEVRTPECPYPGMRPFIRSEADIFFGRASAIERLHRHLATHRFVAIVGSSGIGKSSLARAGLLPTLLTPSLNGSPWLIIDFRPGQHPIRTLAGALLFHGLAPVEESDISSLSAGLASQTVSIADWFSRTEAGPGANLLLLVDQFEETLLSQERAAHEEIGMFLHLLLAGTQDPSAPIHVAISIRSEYIGDCAEWLDLVDAINKGQFLVPGLDRAQLREAIEGPLAVRGGTIEPQLVARLLDDVPEKGDRLPLMQHALMWLWHTAKGRTPIRAPSLRLEDYNRLGGSTRLALSHHADQILSELSPEEAGLAERSFRALTTDLGGAGDRVGRRPLPMSQIAGIAHCDVQQLSRVLDKFRAEGSNFLLPPMSCPLQDDTIIDVTHESLIRKWDTLRRYAHDEYRSAETYRELAQKACEWANGTGTLLEGISLEKILEWREGQRPNAFWAERYGGRFDLAMSFLEESRKKGQMQSEPAIPKPRGSKIFISYRRSDTRQAAGRIFGQLKNRFSEGEIFFDVDTIPIGENFKRHIVSYINSSAVMLVLIGERWVNPSWKRSRMLLGYFKSREDFVQAEIELALAARVPILPVLVDDARMPNEGQLPETIAEFCSFNAASVRSGRDFEKDMNIILEKIEELRKQALKLN